MSDLTHENVRKLAVDVTDDESVAVGIKQVYSETEGIDVLVSNAGYSHIGEASQKSTPELYSRHQVLYSTLRSKKG
jgi:NADP-dependent 3-hydroxy acid dehydrogenase YdfG